MHETLEQWVGDTAREPAPLHRLGNDEPPNTSQSVLEAKPEKTTSAGATARIIASVKKMRPTMCSGRTPTAHKPTVRITRAAACIVSWLTPSGAGAKYTALAPATTRAVRTDARRIR